MGGAAYSDHQKFKMNQTNMPDMTLLILLHFCCIFSFPDCTAAVISAHWPAELPWKCLTKPWNWLDGALCSWLYIRFVQVISPGGPASRCSHQTVMTSQSGGQMWVFGGEYASPSETQFHHYKDLWCYHFASRRWEKVRWATSPNNTSTTHSSVQSQSGVPSILLIPHEWGY